MNILDDHDERHLSCQLLEQLSQHLEQPRSCDASIEPLRGLAEFGKKPGQFARTLGADKRLGRRPTAKLNKLMQHCRYRCIGQRRFPLLNAPAFQNQGTAGQSVGKLFNQPGFAPACFCPEKKGTLPPARNISESGFHRIEFYCTA
ncbi:hypothetical protein JOH50_007181 [Rhizobium leguminosarum]|nr:hypothetical protein [Rhizobium leguminosarum]